jgi:hypothetical protein
LQQYALFAIEKTFENAVLYPCSEADQGAMHPRPASIIGYIVAHYIEHAFVATPLLVAHC